MLGFRIALCVDGQSRFCVNSHNLLGEEAIKHRHLQLLGYEVVQVKSKVSGLLLLWLTKQMKKSNFIMLNTVVAITSQGRCSLALSLLSLPSFCLFEGATEIPFSSLDQFVYSACVSCQIVAAWKGTSLQWLRFRSSLKGKCCLRVQ